jgi:hypothetical protein
MGEEPQQRPAPVKEKAEIEGARHLACLRSPNELTISVCYPRLREPRISHPDCRAGEGRRSLHLSVSAPFSGPRSPSAAARPQALKRFRPTLAEARRRARVRRDDTDGGLITSGLALFFGIGAHELAQLAGRRKPALRLVSAVVGGVLCIGGMLWLLLSIAAFRGES